MFETYLQIDEQSEAHFFPLYTQMLLVNTRTMNALLDAYILWCIRWLSYRHGTNERFIVCPIIAAIS